MDFYTNVCRTRDKILVKGYQGKKQVRVSKAKDREAMKKTKAGRLALIQEKIDALPANASAGRIEALRAKLREEKKRK